MNVLATAGSENDRCSAIKQVAVGRFGVTSQLSGKRKRDSDQDGTGRKTG